MPKNAIAVKTEGKFIVEDEKLLNQMSQDSTQYRDDTAIENITVPRLKIIQSASPERKKSDGAYQEDADEGDFINTLTKELIKGNTGFLFVPVKRQVIYLEWGSLEKGGGLINNYGEDKTVFSKTPISDFGKRITENGNTIEETHTVFGFIINLEKQEMEPILLSFSKTQIKKMKQWNALIRYFMDKKTNRQLPEFAGVYKITTVTEKNSKGEWYNYEIKQMGKTLGIPNIGQKVYDAAKNFRDMIAHNKTNVSFDEEKQEDEVYTDLDKV
jgi:hypothetical protein